MGYLLNKLITGADLELIMRTEAHLQPSETWEAVVCGQCSQENACVGDSF